MAPSADQLTGILNGIDESWDPRVCAQLAQQFGAGAHRTVLALAMRTLQFSGLAAHVGGRERETVGPVRWHLLAKRQVVSESDYPRRLARKALEVRTKLV